MTNDQNVPGVAVGSISLHGKSRGALRVSGKNKDRIKLSVVLHLKAVERQRALDNNLEPGVVYAELKLNKPKGDGRNQTSATQKLILPLLQKSGEPAVEALGNLHLVSEDHFADLAIGPEFWTEPLCVQQFQVRA